MNMVMEKADHKLIILDRDGVINKDSDAYVKSEAEWIPLPRSIEAIVALNNLGYQVVVATNQSGLGRGLFELDDLEAMHAKLCNLVEEAGGQLSGIFYCPHTPEDNCDCRKPKAGLLNAIETELNISVDGVFFVGDSLRDLEAGLTKQCTPVLVKTGKGEKTLQKLHNDNHPLLNTLAIFDDLFSFSQSVLSD